MTGIADATGAPLTITLQGTEYKLRPLKDVDFGEIERELQRRAYRAAQVMATECKDDAEKQELMRIAFQQASTLSMGTVEAMRYLTSLDGLVHMVYLSMRTDQPKMAREQVKLMLSDPEAIEELAAAMEQLNPDTSPKGQARPQARNRAKVRRSKRR